MQINYPSGLDIHRLRNALSRPSLHVVLNLIFNCPETDGKMSCKFYLYQGAWPDPREICSYFSDVSISEGWKYISLHME